MLDSKIVRRGFERAAAGFNDNDFLHREIRGRLLERLQAIRIEPTTVVDLGAGTGAALPELRARFPDAAILPVDLAQSMLAAGEAAHDGICADAAALPLKDGSVDLIFSNLMLHHCPDPPAVLTEARRVLRHPGVLLFTALGPNSLLELGRAWATADRFSHIAPFADMHNVGDALVGAGFAEPVLDSQTLTITYRSFETLVEDLRNAGSVNATAQRNRGLTGRGVADRLRAACLAQANENGQIPITIEVIFGVAWAGEPVAKRGPEGRIEIPVDRIGRGRRS